VMVSPSERRRLVRFGRVLGAHLKDCLSIVSYHTFFTHYLSARLDTLRSILHPSEAFDPIPEIGPRSCMSCRGACTWPPRQSHPHHSQSRRPGLVHPRLGR
jgi:hypothetical protein